MNCSDLLIETLYAICQSPIPPHVELEARKCILDEIGAMYGGARQVAARLQKYLDFQPEVVFGASVVGGGRQTTMEQAALLGGFSGHVFDIDDGNRFCILHPGSSVVPAVLSVCDYRRLSMDDMVRGVVVGYEAAARVARSVQPAHRTRGFHASGTCGAIGAAMGAAAALRLDRDMMKAALGAAVAAASGLLEMQENVSELKPFNLGHAAMAGVSAVSMAQAGFRGPVDPLGGERGFMRVLAGENTNPEVLGAPLGEAYAVESVYHKSYAACRHCHAALDSTMALRAMPGVEPEAIAAVKIRIYEQAMTGHAHKQAPSLVSAKMSVPFAVALALTVGAAGVPDYSEENLRNPQILRLLDVTTMVAEDELTALVPQMRPAIVELTLKDGRTYCVRTDIACGEPELPMPLDAFIRKFEDLMVYGGMPQRQAEQMRDVILHGTGLVFDLARQLR